jgi:hypothetical protein
LRAGHEQHPRVLAGRWAACRGLGDTAMTRIGRVDEKVVERSAEGAG